MGRLTSTRVASYAVLLNLGIISTKAALACVSGSAALAAEAVHGFSDFLASLAIWAGIRISRIRTRQFPLGLYKVENLAALVSAGVIFFAGYEVARANILGKAGASLRELPVSLAGLAAITAAIFLFSRYERRKGEELNSPALKADAHHLRTDIASTLVVLAGLTGAWLGYRLLDRLTAVVVVAFIARTGWRILVGAMRSLLDAAVDPATIDAIRQVVSSDPRVAGIKSIVARNSGSVIFVSLDLSLKLNSLKEAHDASEQIEGAVRRAVQHIEQVHIHYEPAVKDYFLAAVPLSDQEGAISSRFGQAPYLALLKIRPESREVAEQFVITNPYAGEARGKEVKLSRLLLDQGVDVLYVRENLGGKGPAHLMSAGNIKIFNIKHRHLAELLEESLASREK